MDSTCRFLVVCIVLSIAAACTERFEGPDGVVGARVADGIFYVVPADGGVVLVDTGEEEGGSLLRRLISGRQVLAVLVTHAHHDHYASAATFNVPTFVGPSDIARMRGETQHQGAVQRRWREQNGGQDRLPALPADVRPVTDGQVLLLGGRAFQAISLPGHTPGSTAYLSEGLLFGGDAAMVTSGRIEPIEAAYSDDPAQARQSLQKLRALMFHTVLDGHRGITPARAQSVAEP